VLTLKRYDRRLVVFVSVLFGAASAFVAFVSPDRPLPVRLLLALVALALAVGIGFAIASALGGVRVVIDRKLGLLSFGNPGRERHLHMDDIDHAELSARAMDAEGYRQDPHDVAYYRLDLIMRSRERIPTTSSYGASIDVYRRLLDTVNRELASTR